MSLKPMRKSTQKSVIGGVVFLILAAISIVGALQIKQVRQFFSQASGSPANLVVDTQSVLGTMPRPWRNLAQGGEDHNWRIEPISTKVKALNPEYVRLDHIYDFYEIVKGSPGNLQFDFSKFDLVIKDITALGAKPYIAMSYMPPTISSGDILAKPVRWEDWQLVVQKTIEHVSGTLKIEGVYYEVWNEPDLFGGWKYYGEKSYLDLYTYAARGAANAKNVQAFKLGGPAITALYKNWFDALAKHVIQNKLQFDFFSWHRYSQDLEIYPEDMANVRNWVAAYPQLEPTLEFHITEWGHDSNNSPGYDGQLSAAHTVAGSATMLNLVQRAFVFEIQDGKDPKGQQNWGRWGMLTHNDSGAQPKPRYQALKMLERLSSQRLPIQGQGSWVKGLAAKNTTTGGTQVLLANYDSASRHSEQVPLTFTDITPGSFTLKQETLNGRVSQTQVATTAAQLQVTIPMSPNDVIWVELTKN